MRTTNTVIAICLALVPACAGAALSDEIQVYTDDINKPGERGLELHINTTPSGRNTPDYPGEAVPYHGLRVTPEFSWGLTPTLESGLYIPTNLDAHGDFSFAGAKVRMKWLPLKDDPERGGGFLGANVELSHVQQQFSQSRWTSELRIMSGWRNEDWLLAANPVFGWNLSDGLREGTPDFALGLKVARKVQEGLDIGLEYYSEMGPLNHILPASQQDNAIYAAIDLERKGWSLNFGVGWGVTSVADKVTVKAILGFGF